VSKTLSISICRRMGVMAESNQVDNASSPLPPLCDEMMRHPQLNAQQQDKDSARCCNSSSNPPRTVESDTCPVIDNSRNIYLPLQLRCGVTVLCRPEAIMHCPQVLQDLNTDLQQCFRIMPWSVHNLIRRTRIWINLNYRYGPYDKPVSLSHSTAHHHEGWLIWCEQLNGVV